MGGKGAHDCYLARAKYLPNDLSKQPEAARPQRTRPIEKTCKRAKTTFPVRVAMQKVEGSRLRSEDTTARHPQTFPHVSAPAGVSAPDADAREVPDRRRPDCPCRAGRRGLRPGLRLEGRAGLDLERRR